MPYFKGGLIGDSYMELQLELMVVRKDEFAAIFDIRAEQATGLIMYSGSSTASDFISLAMIGGKLEFRYGKR